MTEDLDAFRVQLDRIEEKLGHIEERGINFGQSKFLTDVVKRLEAIEHALKIQRDQ